MERPWWKFYGRDWLADRELHRCSIEARGLWITMLCLMNEGLPYGHMADKKGAISPKMLAAQAYISVAYCSKLIVELETNEVFSRTEAGVIFSRRMVKDEKIRAARAAGGIKSIEHPLTHKPKGYAEGTHSATLNLKDKGTIPHASARALTSGGSDSSGENKKDAALSVPDAEGRFESLAERHPVPERWGACKIKYMELVMTATDPRRTADLLDEYLDLWVIFWRESGRDHPTGLYKWLHDGDCFRKPPAVVPCQAAKSKTAATFDQLEKESNG
jgi:hypothetical protein